MQHRKNISFIAGAFAFVLLVGALLLSPQKTQAAECPVLVPGNTFTILGYSYSPVYIVTDDMERKVFPNSSVYKTWYDTFDSVLPPVHPTCADTLYPFPEDESTLVGYRAGSNLVKLAIDNKVYAVLPGNTIAEIKNEFIAKKIYGTNWISTVKIVPDYEFAGYIKTEPLTSAVPHDGQILRIKDGNSKRTLYVKNGAAHYISGTLPAFLEEDVRYLDWNIIKRLPIETGVKITVEEIANNPVQN
ncbi:MAG: hypothetical protein COU31_01225 [Candidatus Magasanikbacteria bacterium CG10_big_fil_rev_8_21_14_0_10_40_10]|uniref:Uncharacterized protein n=1 Tax=Candidatus Magasanikbacteria bacterium CG10_big_fil_rev_8_21_14_0_10_40_10 TaxID=1974648 RepID=A0A2M6W4P1_9BACT|nr:MAG: hypothetical protein COU31_01225 [Candidatus Magasanikbacteria bacterium CG10_big_fil_rev_8_21_14_0_10_40_10]